MLEQPVPEVLHPTEETCGKDPLVKQFMKNCSPWEGLTLEKIVEDCLPWEGPHAAAVEDCEEKGAAKTTCDELTTTPISHPLVPLGRGRQRKSGVKLSPGRRKRWGEGVLRFNFICHYPTMIWQ